MYFPLSHKSCSHFKSLFYVSPYLFFMFSFLSFLRAQRHFFSVVCTSSGDDYSVEETVIGTWIDGKPIYRKVIKVASWNNDATFDTGLGGQIDAVIRFTGEVTESGGNSYSWPYVSSNYYLTAYINKNTGVFTRVGSLNSINDGSIILEYTKTTD